MSRKQGFVILTVFLVITGFQISAAGQRCGGTVTYVVRDKNDRIIDASKVEVIKNEPAHAASIQPPGGAGMLIPGKASQKSDNVERMPVSIFAVVDCNLPLLELSLKHDGDVMNLRFVTFLDVGWVIDSLPFQPGTFEIDLAEVSRRSTDDKSIFNTTGLKFGNELIMTWHAKGFLLIDAKIWRKIK